MFEVQDPKSSKQPERDVVKQPPRLVRNALHQKDSEGLFLMSLSVLWVLLSGGNVPRVTKLLYLRGTLLLSECDVSVSDVSVSDVSVFKGQ